ncbi:beta-lactamase/transpeptidase-like protein [Cyathus striatus]|nr:beta-lactamase/transpeptidase-like protein [Cyathus striatus]
MYPFKLIPTVILSLFSYTKTLQHHSLNNIQAPLISLESSQYITELLQQWNSTGLAVAAVRRCNDNDTCWVHEFGSYGLFLAVSVGLLISNESLSKDLGVRLDWNTKIADLIPEWGLMDKYASDHATIQDLLSHRTGMPRHDFSRFPSPEGPLGIIKTLRNLRPSAEFRDTFQYNNLMYITLSYLPQVLLNQSYESYVSQHILTPLGMNSTTFSVEEATHGMRFAHGYVPHMKDLTRGYNETKVATFPYYVRPGDESVGAGPGAVWMSMLMNKGRHPYESNRTIVPEIVIDHVARGFTVPLGVSPYPEISPKVYGSGQFRYTYQGHDIIEHGGSNPGFRSQVARFPNDNLGIITLSNDNEGMPVVEAAKWRIAEDVLGLKKVDWIDRYVKIEEENMKQMISVTPRPSFPMPPSLSFERLAENDLYHPAYGTLSPCLVNSNNEENDRCSTLLSSPATKKILSASNLSIPTLIIPWNRTYATHIRLTHFTGNVFNASVIWTNVDSGGDGVLVGLDNTYEVEWAHGPREGLAFKGNFWGREGDSKVPDGMGRDGAEV